MLDRLGRINEALVHFNKAIALDTDDIYALRGREHISEVGDTPLYEKGDVLWDVCELLANAAPSKALKIVKNMDDANGLRGKLYCYGALNEPEQYLETWSKIIQLTDKIDITDADWFYMPEYVFENPNIWALFLSSPCEFSGCCTFFESLEDNAVYRTLPDNDRMRLTFKYYEYLTSKNHEALKQLSETFPEWVELRDHIPPSD